MDVTVEDFDFVFGLNVRAAFFVAQAVARRLLAAKRAGSIINISSQMGHVGAARRTVYCASKHAMEGFTKAMAIELAPHNIRVNSLGPTFLETPMTKPFFENKAFRDEVLSKIKLGRLGQLDELTGAIVFLASDASSLMTGSALVRALKDKKIVGAGLDVYEHEPQVSPELVAMPNVVLTPHLGSAVLSLREGMAHVVVDNTIALIEGKPPVSCLNPLVLKKLF